MRSAQIVPGGEPFFLPGGPVGCLLIHGFTSFPAEMRFLGEDLATRGYTVLGMRQAGHATHPRDLRRVSVENYLAQVEDALAILRGCTKQLVLIGQSLGGNTALLAAARYPVDGVVAIATPYPQQIPPGEWQHFRRQALLRSMERKTPPHPTLGLRREPDYPAYASYPSRAIFTAIALQREMRAQLPEVTVPALIIHAHDDEFVSAEGAQMIHDQLGSRRKELLLVDGMGHGIVRHERRGEVFGAIATFLEHELGGTLQRP